MKKRRIVGFGLALSLVAVLGGCIHPEQVEAVSDESSATSTSENQKESKVQRIGKEGVGYVDVPSDWIRFHDISGDITYQYAALDGYTIITLFSYDKTTLGVKAIDDAAAKQAAEAVVYGMETSGQYGKLTGAKAKVAGNEAYQIYGTTKKGGKMICTWLFITAEKDRVYSVSIEGDRKDTTTLQTLIDYVEKTWSSKK